MMSTEQSEGYTVYVIVLCATVILYKRIFYVYDTMATCLSFFVSDYTNESLHLRNKMPTQMYGRIKYKINRPSTHQIMNTEVE